MAAARQEAAFHSFECGVTSEFQYFFFQKFAIKPAAFIRGKTVGIPKTLRWSALLLQTYLYVPKLVDAS
jgi:hypothetical protein